MNAPEKKLFMQTMKNTSLLSGGNDAFVEGLYEDYLQDASSVPAEWRAYFDKLQAANMRHDVAHSPMQRGFLRLGQAPGRSAGAPETRHASRLRYCNSSMHIVFWERALPILIR